METLVHMNKTYLKEGEKLSNESEPVISRTHQYFDPVWFGSKKASLV